MRALYVVLISTILSSAWSLDGSTLPRGVKWGKKDKRGLTWGFKWTKVDENIGILAPKNNNKKNSNTLDGRISDSLDTTKNMFAEISGDLEVASFGLQLLPYLGPVVAAANSFVGILSHETDWKAEFLKTVSREITEEILKNDINKMDTKLPLIEQYISSVNDTIQNKLYSDTKNKTVESDAEDIYKYFNEMIIEFTKENSKFKHFPLLAAPFLIEMSLFVSVFDPIQIALLDRDLLSCQIRDGIMDYIPFVVEDRLSKLNTDLTKLTEFRNIEYNRHGYNNLTYLDCNTETCVNACIIDEFSTKKYQRNVPGAQCERNYVLHLRHLVENMFPLEQLDKTCDRPEGEPTGFGWVTIKLGGIFEVFIGNNLRCDTRGLTDHKCDPYVKITIGENEIHTTSVTENPPFYYVDRIFTSENKIEKDTTPIKIETFDADNKVKDFAGSKLALKIEGTVDSLMKTPYYCPNDNNKNCLEVVVLWQNERKPVLKKNN